MEGRYHYYDLAGCEKSDPEQGIQAANTAGIPIVSGSNGTDDPNPRLNLEKEGLVDFLYDVGPDYRALGTAMAEWMESDRDLSGHAADLQLSGILFRGIF